MPPPTHQGQIRSEGMPLHRQTPRSKPTYSTSKMNQMSVSILPIVGIVTIAIITVVLGLAAMHTKTPLDMQMGEHYHLRVGSEQALPDE